MILLAITSYLNQVMEFLNQPLVRLGDNQLSILSIFILFFSFIMVFFIAGRTQKFLLNRLLARYSIEYSTRLTIAVFVRYLIIIVGLLVVFQSAGINLSTLSILFGALGVGIGFGLQNITNNLISGIIILFEKPIKVGDRVEVGETEGVVDSITTRSTTIITNDNISIIVPNSEFISERVINWSHRDAKVRFKIPVSVSYNSDVRLVERLLLEVGRESPDALDDPPPGVRFMGFGDSGLHFELRVWSVSLVHKKGKLLSDLNFAIIDKFRKHNIEIPYPQVDLNFKNALKQISESEAK